MDYYTTKEIAKVLGVTGATLVNWRHAGQGPPFIKYGDRVYRYPKDAFEQWQDQMKHHSSGEDLVSSLREELAALYEEVIIEQVLDIVVLVARLASAQDKDRLTLAELNMIESVFERLRLNKAGKTPYGLSTYSVLFRLLQRFLSSPKEQGVSRGVQASVVALLEDAVAFVSSGAYLTGEPLCLHTLKH